MNCRWSSPRHNGSRVQVQMKTRATSTRPQEHPEGVGKNTSYETKYQSIPRIRLSHLAADSLAEASPKQPGNRTQGLTPSRYTRTAPPKATTNIHNPPPTSFSGPSDHPTALAARCHRRPTPRRIPVHTHTQNLTPNSAKLILAIEPHVGLQNCRAPEGYGNLEGIRISGNRLLTPQGLLANSGLLLCPETGHL